MSIWHDIDASRITPDDFIACIEISKGSKNKYEVDKSTGMLILDRILYTATHYPSNYGFIPRTYADDGDPLDVLVICSEPLVPLSLVRCYPIGQIAMMDEGKEDIKIIAIPFKDPMWNSFKKIEDLPIHIIEEMRHFFGVYKQLEGKKMTVLEMSGVEVAKKTITDNINVYNKMFVDHV